MHIYFPGGGGATPIEMGNMYVPQNRVSFSSNGNHWPGYNFQNCEGAVIDRVYFYA